MLFKITVMPRMIYEYTITILEKVSTDPEPFSRELKKASKCLMEHELVSLSKWLYYYTDKKSGLRKIATNFVEETLVH